MKTAAESPKRKVPSSSNMAGAVAAYNGGVKTKRTALGDSTTEFPLLLKRRSPNKKDAAKKASGIKQSVELPKVSSSSITYSHAPQPLESGEELEVLKAILVREGYLQRLAHASAHGRISGSHLGDTVDLLDLLRVATLEAVEAIGAWRTRTKKPTASYSWNGINYLLKLASDLDYLQKHTGLVQWLGFTLARNPFVLPRNLDCQARLAASDVSRDARPASSATTTGSATDSSRFFEVGGKRRLDISGSDGRLDRPTSPSRVAAHAAALAERKRAKNPYETRVVNDEELLPLSATSSGNATPTKDRVARPKSRIGSAALVMPSKISELDMARIRNAEAVVLHEEAQCGRFTRDAQGRIVPEAEARRRVDMVELSGDAYAALQHADSRSTATVVTRTTSDRKERYEDDPNDVQLRTPPPSLAGKQYAKKRASMLGPITKPKHRPVLPMPRERSRGAQLEVALEHERQAHARFGVQIDALREEIERRDMDVAYFESLTGVQCYGDELREFSVTARRDIALLRRELREKLEVYDAKAANIHRKAEIIHVFKVSHKDAAEAARAAEIEANKRRAERDAASAAAMTQTTVTAMASATQQRDVLASMTSAADVAHTRSIVAPIVLHMCATLIQKIARGMLTRAACANLRIEYYVASKYIQAAVRGFLVRRRVATLYWHRSATLVLQCVARGFLARRRVQVRRRQQRELQNTLLIQKVVRGHFGRRRMMRVRHLSSARTDVVAAAARERLCVSDLTELADACFRMVPIPSCLQTTSTSPTPLTPLVLGLVRVLMLFTSDSDAAVDVSAVRWREAAHFLRCGVALTRRMQLIASAAESGQYVRRSALGLALLDTYKADRAFCIQTFELLARGWRAATSIFHWVTAFAVVARLQTVQRPTNHDSVKPFEVARALSRRELQQHDIEAHEHATRTEDVERRFVPAALTQAAGFPHHRPRPVLLVIAHDVPTTAKDAIVSCLLAALPGLFVVMNRAAAAVASESLAFLQSQPSASRAKRTTTDSDWEGLSFAEIRDAVRNGLSVVLETDVGLRDASQRQFIHAFAALKSTIEPAPLCVLVKGSLQNYTAVAESLAHSSPSTTSTTSSDRPMADAALKHAFECVAQHLRVLALPHVTTQMMRLSSVEQPAVAFIAVAEAVIILLTPSKRYDGPRASTSAVSWRLARQLLTRPQLFIDKLRNVALDRDVSIVRDNLRTLERYVQHVDWPTPARARSAGADSELLVALASYVKAVVHCAQLVAECDGIAPALSRSAPVRGLFDSVVTYEDAERQVACRSDSEDANDSSGSEVACVHKLLDAVLADVRVYRTCCTLLDGRRCVVSVFHDCERIFVAAYDPTSSYRWLTVVAESDVDRLLAPNSLERENVKTPPATRNEMYRRLVQLCLLQTRRGGRGRTSHIAIDPVSRAATAAVCARTSSLDRNSSSKLPPSSTTSATMQTVTSAPGLHELVLQPRAIRLFRRALQLNGRLTTVTISELSRGRVQVDAFVHNASSGCGLHAIFGLERILARLSAQVTRAFVVAPASLPALVLDRLHLYRIKQSRVPRDKCIGSGSSVSSDTTLIDTSMALKLCVRTRERAPGRLLMRRAVRSPSLDALWLCSVVELHATRALQLEFYQPQTSDRFVMPLAATDANDIVCTSKHASRSALQVMLTHLRFHVDTATGCAVRCTPRCVLARFPYSIPVRTNPHQVLNAREVVRTYVQVERLDANSPSGDDSPCLLTASPEQRRAGRLRYRICLPDSCIEQTLTLDDSEVESFFTDNSWAAAWCPIERKRMSREVVKCFVWDLTTVVTSDAIQQQQLGVSSGAVDSAHRCGCVVALLPSGAVEAIVTTRVTRSTKRLAPAHQSPSQTKRSPFTARSSIATGTGAAVPLLSSCIHLLEALAYDDSSQVLPALVRRCYTYDIDELVHQGSYRANGVRVHVQVLMRAVVVNSLAPQVPVDRVQQRDAFALTFRFYDPRSSSSATVVVHGRDELREVVGPDRADLIRADAVHALVQHIVERRTDVVLSATAPVTHSQSFRGQDPPLATLLAQHTPLDAPLHMTVRLQRDRLFAKYKATPLHARGAIDMTANAVKLIDRAPERGVKVLTRTRVVPGAGRVIFTVYDVAATQRREHPARDYDEDAVLLRVDAYVHDTSARLSLLANSADLLHVVGDRVDLLEPIGTAHGGSGDDSEYTSRTRTLAQLMIDHVGIEARHDGVTPDRLFFTELFAPAVASQRDQQQPLRTLLFKTTRAVGGHDQVLLSLYLLVDGSLAVKCYAPRSSETCDVVVRHDVLCLVLGRGDDDDTEHCASALLAPTVPRYALMTHICSFVHVEMRASLPSLQTDTAPAVAVLSVSFVFDEQRARVCRARLSELERSSVAAAAPRAVAATWSGLMIGTARPNVFGVRIQLHTSSAVVDATDSTAGTESVVVPDECEVVCSVMAPSAFAVATATFASSELEQLVPDGTRATVRAVELLMRVRERLQLELEDAVSLTGGSDADEESVVRIRLQYFVTEG